MDIDSNNDGYIDEVEYYTHDSNGNMIMIEVDDGDDGSIDQVIYLTYNSNGNNTMYETDDNNDGFMEEIGYRIYDSNGHLTELQIDFGAEGSIDASEYYTNDSNGNMVSFEYDHNRDGFPEAAGYATNDSNGNMTRLEIDTDYDGSIDYVDIRTYDLNGNMIKRELDLDNDGSMELVYNFTSWTYIQGPGEPGVPWVQIGGEVTYEGTRLSAMVLANGQHMFTNNPIGEYSLYVPLNVHGEITLYAFCGGMAPFKRKLTYEEAAYFDISMELPESSQPMNVTHELSPSLTKSGWVTISGRVTGNDETPLSAMALANGKKMFTNNPIGEYSLDVPLNPEGKITLYVFCGGMEPYKEIISDIPDFPDVASYAGTYIGTFTGDDWGTWTVTIDSQGNISGSYYSQQFYHTVSISGSVDSYGNLTMATGGTSTGADFVGTVDSLGNVQGTWDNPYDDYSGTFSGSKNN
jgi:hypothetical protein